MKKLQTLLSLSFVTALAVSLSSSAFGGVSSGNTLTSGTISGISKIEYGSADNIERLKITGVLGSITIDNKSTSAVAARILATCFKSAQLAVSTGGSLVVSTKNLNTSASSGITGSLSSSGNYSITFTAGYPVASEQKQFLCGVSQPVAEL